MMHGGAQMIGHAMSSGWVWLVIAALLIFALLMYLQPNGNNTNTQDQHIPHKRKRKRDEKPPREIADERYARGELSREEYLILTSDMDDGGDQFYR